MNNQEEAERGVWDLFYCSHQGNGLGVPPTLQPGATTDVALSIRRAGGRPTHAVGAALGKTLSRDMSQGKHPRPHLVLRAPQKVCGVKSKAGVSQLLLARALETTVYSNTAGTSPSSQQRTSPVR